MLSGLEFSKRFFDFKYSLLLFITISSMTTPSSLALTTSDFLFSDLCSVNTTSTKTCYNDWISRPGTCYEDSCCVSFETATSWYYRTAQASQVVFSSMGLVVLTVYALKYSSKHMLPSNVRVLVNIILILMFTHSIDMIIFHVYHIFRSYKAVESDPCSVRVKISFCAPFRYIYSFCTLGLAFCQYCVYIDRLLCALYKEYIKYQKVIQYLLVILWVIVTTGVVVWVYRDANLDAYLLSCLNVPLDSMLDLSYVTATVFPINIGCCFLSMVMFRHFKKKENKSRFEIISHFTASVDVDSSEFLYIVTISQAVFIVVYPVLSLSMRYFYAETYRPVHLTIATLVYVFDIYCFVVPLAMVNYGRNRTDTRRAKIWSHVKIKSVGKEGADNYFGMMKSQWE
ncbi:G_PROTEIN_RECEP_F1_2 domain-containing protein [Caenorhabditis elegans]|uniref:G_PROTEIN_RECEP_F1_2 domain-containing protein n=1 Tax=Caenorhabditis elegans TaxID=6239 RepID=Q5CCI8_CAEEL|nr:G_PROTEIN_RECEP_F1_2 domain-containing protein [Caenorhabditis elegans]CCD62990.1 G_PROTEIN_RECEP_F1_2 domain-containing protein [Caenorhabditis elegans]|eukprot:NP_504936.2 Serpentine Receptor, class B (beta) [Caenorhabditis elegans]